MSSVKTPELLGETFTTDEDKINLWNHWFLFALAAVFGISMVATVLDLSALLLEGIDEPRIKAVVTALSIVTALVAAAIIFKAVRTLPTTIHRVRSERAISIGYQLVAHIGQAPGQLHLAKTTDLKEARALLWDAVAAKATEHRTDSAQRAQESLAPLVGAIDDIEAALQKKENAS